MVELSRPEAGVGPSSFHSAADGRVTDEEQSEFPEADTPLFSCQDENDGVFKTTDESGNLPNDNEESDVLTAMPRDGSAVIRFDRFLKERKDSELLNLMALRREMDDGGMEGAEYIKSFKELEENELLRKQVQTLESTKNTEELEKENALLKEKVESVNDLEEENQLLKEEIEILRQSTAVEDIEEENSLLKDKIKMLEELAISEEDVKKIEEENDELREKVKTLEDMVTSEQDSKKISEEENDELREKVKTLEEMMEVSELDMKKTEQENVELKAKLETLEESSNAELEKENDYLKQQVAMMAAEHQRVKELEEEDEILREKIQVLEASAVSSAYYKLC